MHLPKDKGNIWLAPAWITGLHRWCWWGRNKKNNSLLWSLVSHGVWTECLEKSRKPVSSLHSEDVQKFWFSILTPCQTSSGCHMTGCGTAHSASFAWISSEATVHPLNDIDYIDVRMLIIRMISDVIRMWSDFTLRLRQIVEIELTFTIFVNPWRMAEDGSLFEKLVTRVLDASFIFLYL